MILYVCNIFSDQIRKKRSILNLNESAYNKVLVNCKFISQFFNIEVLSLGYGMQNKTKNVYFKLQEEKINKLSINYCQNINIKYLNAIFSSIYLALNIFKNKKKYNKVIFYNPLLQYIPAVIICRIYNLEMILDFEDGQQKSNFFINFFFKLKILFYNNNIKKFILINENLKKYLQPKNNYIINFGFFDIKKNTPNQNSKNKITVLFSGNLDYYTGTDVYIDFIEKFYNRDNLLFNEFNFIITGDGPLKDKIINKLEKIKKNIELKFDLSAEEYKQILLQTDLAINLRNYNYQISNETFPTKIIEYSNYKIPIISTRSNEIKNIFCEDEIFFLKKLTTEDLISTFIRIHENKRLKIIKQNLTKKNFNKINIGNTKNMINLLKQVTL